MAVKFAENFKRIRRVRCISQKEIAERLGVSQAVVSMWETGEVLPTIERLVGLTKILSCSSDALLGIEDEEEKL